MIFIVLLAAFSSFIVGDLAGSKTADEAIRHDSTEARLICYKARCYDLKEHIYEDAE